MNLADFHFLRPWCLLTLIPVGILWYVWYIRPLSRGNWLDVCDAELLPYILQTQPLPQKRSSSIMGCLAAVLAVLALAGPTWQHLPSPAYRNETALVIALDLSVTMDASDIKPSRLGKARYKIADLLKLRKDGQTALMVYRGDTFTVTPLTTDTATIASQLEALNTDIMPSSGRDTDKAINEAVNLLQPAGVGQGDILLITDSIEPAAIDHAESHLNQYRLSVLAVGTSDGAPISQSGGGFVKDASGNIVLARLDRNALIQLTNKTKGLFQLVSNDDTDVNKLQKYFDARIQEDKNQQNNILLQQWDELGPEILLLVLPWAAWQFRKGLWLWLLLILLPMPKTSQALDWQSLWLNANQRAEQAFRQQNYQQAAEQFSNPEWRAAAQYKAGDYQQAAETLKDSQTADGFYNRGNALAKAGQLSEAVAAYQQALKLDSNHQDAAYNKALVEKQLQGQKQQDKQNNKDKQDKQDKQDQQEKQQQDQQKSEQQNQEGKPSDQQKPSDGQSEQKQNAQSDNQQQQSADKPETKPEENQSQPAKDKQEPAADAEQQSAKSQSEQDVQAEKLAKPEEKSQAQKANEQLLKRIPDEPTGLLKRKFKHLLNQREKSGQSDPHW